MATAISGIPSGVPRETLFTGSELDRITDFPTVKVNF
jgi:hypothetical protein